MQAHVILDAYGNSNEATSLATIEDRNHLHVSKPEGREPEQPKRNGKPSEERRSRVVVISHKTKAGSECLVENIKLYLSKERREASVEHFGDLAHTLFSHRSALTWRAAVTASTCQELTKALEEPGVEPRRALIQPQLSLIFTGQGAQWYAMGRGLIHGFSVFRHSLEAAEGCLRSLGVDWSLMGRVRLPRFNDNG